jgi:hypothetical protein
MDEGFQWSNVSFEAENTAHNVEVSLAENIHLSVRREINPGSAELSLLIDDFTRDALEECVVG